MTDRIITGALALAIVVILLGTIEALKLGWLG